MNISSQSQNPLPAKDHTYFYLIGIALFTTSLWISLGPGDIYDESEHLHVAYLLSLGQQINIDFFQHHQPLLWDILTPIYRMGVNSFIVYYLARAIVLLCFISSIFLLKELSRQMTRNLGSLIPHTPRRHLPFCGFSGLLVLTLPLISMPAMMVIRPETIGCPALFGSLLVWMKKKNHFHALSAGVLMGFAASCSIRFIILLPLLWVLSPQCSIKQKLMRSLSFLGSMSMIFFLLANVPGRNLLDIINYLKFSAILQKVGPGNMIFAGTLIISITWASLLCVLISIKSANRPLTTILYFCILIIVLVFSLLTGWPYLYPQNFIPFFCCAAILATIMECAASRRNIFDALSVGIDFVLVLVVVSVFIDGIPLARNVALKKFYISLLHQGDTVILRSHLHPVLTKDGSFYGVPITDGGNRLCLAVNTSQAFMKIPACNYASDIQTNRPILVDAHCLYDASIRNNRAFLSSFYSNYSRINSYVFLRNDRLYLLPELNE